MFELSVACKYLLPRRRQLSVSIISLISILVISLVVWLIVVFFSITDGLEKSWIQKLTALTSPVRITPTDAYYNSYYYQVDSLSEASGYSHKTINEKRLSNVSDPYDPSIDEELPSFWPAPDLGTDGQVKDIVQRTFAAINEVKGVPEIKAQDFELTASQIKLRVSRDGSNSQLMHTNVSPTYLNYPAYLGNFESDNSNLSKTILAITTKDVNNYFSLIGIANNVSQEAENEKQALLPPDTFRARLRAFLEQVNITHLKTKASGWTIPSSIIPSKATWNVVAIYKGDFLFKIIIPANAKDLDKLIKSLDDDANIIAKKAHLNIHEGNVILEFPNENPVIITNRTPLSLNGGTELSAQFVESSLNYASRLEDLKFNVQSTIQGVILKGVVPYRGLEIGKADFSQAPSDPAMSARLWVHRINEANDQFTFVLPQDSDIGEGILIPKGFKDAGVLAGDRGFLTYFSPTASMLQEQHLPVYVAGFYDPGIIPIGGKFVLANRDVISIIRSAHNADDRSSTNGINVRFKDFHQADDVKAQLLQAFKKNGISRYWHVETYREYEFTKEIMRELQSQKNIFAVIAVVIILVACSNIISMLVILVNDKKVEIGILRSMGATSKSIALIFGLAGSVIGIVGSLFGILAAILTVKNLQVLLSLISQLQGYDLFNAAFYGENVPQELSLEALSFVLLATMIISLLAGIVPAVKACLLKPTSILRATG
ncbi:MAG: ABC transporter permease [Parachlamydiaceae bacterium]|nr:ABC transporter permease [Parachlamydiaceae bacterium]